ncbi:MAG: DEAD/DEAH box helicase [Chitinophagaceae bacterium]|nr:DEAD/DEAH box helicase [Chitinophagaceae bacterium]
MSFLDLKLIEPLVKAVQEEGYTTPTPIQAQAIPIILNRKDLLGCAQTGTGKTAAFAIPMLQLLCEDAAGLKQDVPLRAQRPIKALILTPTRELAIQIGDSFAAYGRYTGMEHLVIFGGVPQNPQVHALRKGIDILVATPGRLLDLMDQRHINLQNISFFVLDEADRMLDMGFVHDVKKVIARLPQKRQSLFFSATMPPEIQKLAGTILTNPAKVEVTPVSSTAETIQQSIYFVDRKDKRSLLLHVLKTQPIPTALVFTRTKHGADKVAQGLTRAGVRAEAIHGNKSQNARQRALLNFKTRQTRILVATDIAARGIDIDELTHVINFELPNVPETYVHRIGRTGRAGASGIALSFCDAEEKEYLRDIEKLIGMKVPVVEDHPHPMGNMAVIQPVAASMQGGNGRDAGRGRQNNNGHSNNGRGRDGRGNGQQKNNAAGGRGGRNGAAAGHNGHSQRSGQSVIRKGAVTSLAELEALESQPQQEAVQHEPRKEHQQQVHNKREPKIEPGQQQDHNKLEPKKEHGHQDPSKRISGNQDKKRPPRREPQAVPPAKGDPQQISRQWDEQNNFVSNLKLNQSEGDEKW